MNQMQLIAQLMRGRDPQEVVMAALNSGQINNPMVSALIKYAQTGDEKEFVNLAQQMFQARGLNLDNEFTDFMNYLK